MDHNMDHGNMDMPTSSPSAPIPSSTGHVVDHTTTFGNSYSTPLYSTPWTPTSAGTYAATCIFLIVLAIAGRGLVASKAVLEQRWRAAALNSQRDDITIRTPEEGDIETSDPDVKMGTVATAQRVGEQVPIGRKVSRNPAPFQLAVDLPRALLFTVITGVTFLLMLAIMTMNIGYFCSILAGTFLGELAVGRYNHIITG